MLVCCTLGRACAQYGFRLEYGFGDIIYYYIYNIIYIYIYDLAIGYYMVSSMSSNSCRCDLGFIL